MKWTPKFGQIKHYCLSGIESGIVPTPNRNHPGATTSYCFVQTTAGAGDGTGDSLY